jgi:hypothetical protein
VSVPPRDPHIHPSNDHNRTFKTYYTLPQALKPEFESESEIK